MKSMETAENCIALRDVEEAATTEICVIEEYAAEPPKNLEKNSISHCH